MWSWLYLLSAITKECEALSYQLQIDFRPRAKKKVGIQSRSGYGVEEKHPVVLREIKHYSATAQRAILIKEILSFMDRLVQWLFKGFVVFGILFRHMIKLVTLVIRKLAQDWVQLRVFVSTDISLHDAAAFPISNRSSPSQEFRPLLKPRSSLLCL